MSDDEERPAPVSSLKARFEQLSRASSSTTLGGASAPGAAAAPAASSSAGKGAAPGSLPSVGLRTRREGSAISDGSGAVTGQLDRAVLSSGDDGAAREWSGGLRAPSAAATAGAGVASSPSSSKAPSAVPTPSSSPPRPTPSSLRKSPSATWPPPLPRPPSPTSPASLSPLPDSSAALPLLSSTSESAARKKGPPPPIPSKRSAASLALLGPPAASPAPKPPLPTTSNPSTATSSSRPTQVSGLPAFAQPGATAADEDGDDEPATASVSALRSRFGGVSLSSTKSGPSTPLAQPTAFLRPPMPVPSHSYAPSNAAEMATSAPATLKPGPPPMPGNRPSSSSPAPAPSPSLRRAPSTGALVLNVETPGLEVDVEVVAPVHRARSPAPPPPPSRALRVQPSRPASTDTEQEEGGSTETLVIKAPPAIPARPRATSGDGLGVSVVPPTPSEQEPTESAFLTRDDDDDGHDHVVHHHPPPLSISPAAMKPPLPARKATTTPTAAEDDVVPGPPAPDLPARVSTAMPTVPNRQATAPPPLPERSKTLSSVSSSIDGADEPVFFPPPPPPPPPPTRATGAGARDGKLPLRAVAKSVSRVTASASSSRGGSGSSSDSNFFPPPPPPPQRTDTIRQVQPPPQDDDDELAGVGLDDSDADDDVAAPAASASTGGGSGIHRAVSVSVRRVDEYPDPTLSNRRPPYLRHRPKPIRHASGHTHAASFACADRFVAVGSYHLRVYDAESAGLELVCKLDQKETGLEIRSKEARVSALCFRPSVVEGEANRWLWAGTSEGHLFEVDVWSSIVTQTKAAAHASATGGGGGASGAELTNIWTYAGQMFVLDESGRSARYAPNAGGQYNLATPAQAARIAEKQTFAALLGSRIWTSSGPSSSSSTSRTGSKLPTIRIYEPFATAGGDGSATPVPSAAGGRVLAVPDTIVGAVTCGTILPSQPSLVYLGHEGGQVSTWDRAKGAFVSVVKVSATAVTCLEGVGDRLWAGSRKGIICVYDIKTKPWTVTNMWAAHDKDMPVIGLMVDPTSIQTDFLKVYSWGRDDCVHAWDGLLEEDWIDQRLLEREAEFCSYRDLKVISCSWNIDAAKPVDLSSTTDNASFLANVLTSEESPDIVIFGFQEIIPLEDKKLAAKSFLFGKAKGSNNEMSDKVSQRYRLWHDKLVQAMRVSLPPDSPYTVVHAQNLVGLFTCIFVKNAEVVNLRDICITTVKRGMAGMLGNKGAIIARFVVDDSSMCFINCHLAAGQNQKAARNADLASILDEEARFPVAGLGRDELAYVGGGDGSMILDHDICLLQGDLNYRIDLRRENVISSLRAGDQAYLLEHDQLLKEMRNNPGFRLRTFSEAPIAFDPTYKYNRGTHDYDTSEKKRVPAWCDRILYRSRVPENVEALHYTRYEPTLSDHRPISAGFHVKVRRVRERERNALKDALAEEFVSEISGPILDAQHAFYASL